MKAALRQLAAGLIGVAAVCLAQLDSPLHLAEREADAAYPPSAEGSHVAVATDNGEATRAALATLARGGNAFDAAITAALTLGVVSPLASGLGGGGFALVYSAKDKKIYALDFRESAPEKVDVEALVGRHKKEDSKTRGVSVGVPGEPAGLEWLSEHFAKRSLAEDAAPAAALADNGFVLGRNLAEQLAMTFVREEIAASPELTSLFYPGGVPLAYGAKMKRPELGRTIAQFGAEGSAAFYRGAIAQEIAKAVQAAGGTMTEKDLADYKVQMRKPLMREIDGKQVYTMGAPSAGGLMLLETLGMYGASPSSPLAKHGFGSSSLLHLEAEAMRGAVADRARIASDPTVQKTVEAAYDAALEPKQMELRKKRIDLRKTTQAPEFRSREHGTSHLIIADDGGKRGVDDHDGERADGRAHRRRQLGDHPERRARRLLGAAGHRRLRAGRARAEPSAAARPAGIEHDAGDRDGARSAAARGGRKRRRAHRHRGDAGGDRRG